jgi:hypothetical protein
MIIYNVTVNIEDNAHDEWLDWMKKEHLPQVMATGMFVDYKMLKLISRQEDETGQTYAIQYSCANLESYESYQEKFAPALQAETKKKFEGKFVAFRTLLEVIEF